MEEDQLFESIRDYIDGEARCFIVNEEATLGTLYEKIGKDFGMPCMQIRRQVKAGRVFAMSVEECQNFATEGQYTF